MATPVANTKVIATAPLRVRKVAANNAGSINDAMNRILTETLTTARNLVERTFE